ncbi:MAG: hypothetical protein RIR26_601 [Pseudomonadota bacterium]|jgi:hypothetical protein
MARRSTLKAGVQSRAMRHTFVLSVFLLPFLSACRFKKSIAETSDDATLTPLPFVKAGEQNDVTLALVHGEALQTPPAAVRPDPDLYARRLLKQFRSDGNTLARQLGQLEQYRLMLGGASEDFRTVPQDTYDSTSLLTLQKVAREICVSLINPTSGQHPGWNSVLPYALSDVENNMKFLMQKMLGLPETELNATALSELVDIVRSFPENGSVTKSSYVYGCTALALDAEALLL